MTRRRRGAPSRRYGVLLPSSTMPRYDRRRLGVESQLQRATPGWCAIENHRRLRSSAARPRIVRRLASRGAEVTSIAPEPEATAHGHELRELRVDCVRGPSTLRDPVLHHVIAPACAVLITDDHDGGNADLALRIRKLDKDVPIIVRIFDQTLAD